MGIRAGFPVFQGAPQTFTHPRPLLNGRGGEGPGNSVSPSQILDGFVHDFAVDLVVVSDLLEELSGRAFGVGRWAVMRWGRCHFQDGDSELFGFGVAPPGSGHGA